MNERMVEPWSIEERMATKRAEMLTVLATRFPRILTHGVREKIQNTNKLELLQIWLIAAIRVESSAEFLSVLDE